MLLRPMQGGQRPCEEAQHSINVLRSDIAQDAASKTSRRYPGGALAALRKAALGCYSQHVFIASAATTSRRPKWRSACVTSKIAKWTAITWSSVTISSCIEGHVRDRGRRAQLRAAANLLGIERRGGGGERTQQLIRANTEVLASATDQAWAQPCP